MTVTRAAPRTEERALIARAREGDHAAFGELVERYQGAVYGLAYRMLGRRDEAEDAAQEVFYKLYRQLARYDPERLFSTWTLAIATNHCIDQLRRRRLRLVPLEETASAARDVAPGPEALAIGRDGDERLVRLLGELPERYRTVLVLRYWHDLAVGEIATTLGIPEGTVKTQLHRARRALGERMEREEETHALRGV